MNTSRRDFLSGAAAFGGAVAANALQGCASSQGAGGKNAIAAPSDGTIRIAHCGDPQFGFGKAPGGNAYDRDLERFVRVIDAINRERPALAFIAGDMTHKAEDVTRDWPRLLKMFKVPVVVTPGNHDLGNPLRRSCLERYREVFGYDYASFRVGRWRFVSGNTMYWYKTEEEDEKRRYEEWLAAEFAGAKEAGEPVVVGGHVAPFMANAREPDTYENHPRTGRVERLKMYLDGGTRFYLSGHTHRLVVRSYRGMPILNPETTCRNSDGMPFGFRMLTVHPDGNWGWDFRRA